MSDESNPSEPLASWMDEEFVEFQEYRRSIRDKIIHTLTIFPKLSPSMLQVGIGTSIAPKIWHAILDDLTREGIVVQESKTAKAPSGRDLSYTIIQLAKAE